MKPLSLDNVATIFDPSGNTSIDFKTPGLSRGLGCKIF
jgi:hypothetical protein